MEISKANEAHGLTAEGRFLRSLWHSKPHGPIVNITSKTKRGTRTKHWPRSATFTADQGVGHSSCRGSPSHSPSTASAARQSK